MEGVSFSTSPHEELPSNGEYVSPNKRKIAEVADSVLGTTNEAHVNKMAKVDQQDFSHLSPLIAAVKRARTKDRLNSPNPPEKTLKLAEEVAASLNQSVEAEIGGVTVNPYPRIPLERLVINQPIEGIGKFTRTLSYNKCINSLRVAFSGVLAQLQANGNADYIIVDQGADKSTRWCVSHVLDMMSEHPPKGIVEIGRLGDFLTAHPEVQDIIYLDDAAYSGMQAEDNLKEAAENIENTVERDESDDTPTIQFHLCVGQWCNRAKNALQNLTEDPPQDIDDTLFHPVSVSHGGWMLSVIDWAEYTQTWQKQHPEAEGEVFDPTDFIEEPILVWPDHKATDGASTDSKMMEKATNKTVNSIPEPYKNNEEQIAARFEQVTRLGGISPENDINAALGITGLKVVESNAGLFLLSDNYIQPPIDDRNQVELTINEIKMPFGGKTGLPQWRYREGDELLLKKGDREIKIICQNGEFKLSPPHNSEAQGQVR